MGQGLKIKAGLLAASLACFAALSVSSTAPVHAAAQTHPAVTQDALMARDANTFQNDKALDAACRKTGQANSVCLCVTHVMKYELSLNQYRATTRLYGTTTDREAIRQTLLNEGILLSDIKVAEQMEQSLIGDPNFSYRCADAKAYYKTSAN